VSINQELESVVRDLYISTVAALKNEGIEFGSAEFLGSSYVFISRGENETTTRLVSAAFPPSLRSSAEEAIQALYANSSGLTHEGYMCEAVNDFLNYVIPRAAGLKDETSIFDAAYAKFDESIYGQSVLVTSFAILGNVWDNSGRVVLPGQFSLRYVSPATAGPHDNKWLRDRTVPYYEIKRAAHPIGRGREIQDQYAYFIFEYSELLPRSKDVFFSASRLRDDIARKFVLAVRLLKYSAAFSDYRGCRMVGRLATHHMDIMNFPDEYPAEGPSYELQEYDGLALRRLLPKLARMDYNDVSVLATKLDDVIRRPRTTMLQQRETDLKVAIEQLLDCFQILESIIPVAGSEYIALYATVLLRASGRTQFSTVVKDPYTIFQFIKRMHTIRNAVVHGRVGEVLGGGKLKISLEEVHTFRVMVYHLAALSILNGGNLRELATKLAVGEQTQLESFSGMTVEEMNAMRSQKATHPSW